MPALTVNGITIPIRADTFEESRVTIGDAYQRSIGGAMFSSMISKRRRFTFSTPPLEASLAEKYAKLIEGTAQVWNFDGNLRSGSGITSFTSSGASTSSANRKYGSQALLLTAGSGFEVQLANKFGISGGWSTYGYPRQGWTIAFWIYLGTADQTNQGWYHVIATGNGPVVRGAFANPPGVRQYRNGQAGNYSYGNMLKIDSSTTCGVFGYTTPAPPTAPVVTARDIDDLVFFPFSMPEEWVSGFFNYCQSFESVTNLIVESEDIADNGDWFSVGGTTVVSNFATSPDGSSGAVLVRLAGGSGYRGTRAFFGSNGTKLLSVYLKVSGVPNRPSITDINVVDATAGVDRHIVRVTWSTDGRPTLSTYFGSGTLFVPIEIKDGWWRIAFTADNCIGGANQNYFNVYPSGLPSSSGGDVLVWGAQGEDLPATQPAMVRGYVPTAGGVASTLSTGLGYCPAPLVDVSGDHLFDGLGNRTVRCFGRVEQVPHINVKTSANYTTRPNVKVLNVTLEEQ